MESLVDTFNPQYAFHSNHVASLLKRPSEQSKTSDQYSMPIVSSIGYSTLGSAAE